MASGRLHCVGVSAVNALADWLEPEIRRNGTVYDSHGVLLDDLGQTGTIQSDERSIRSRGSCQCPTRTKLERISEASSGTWSWYLRGLGPTASGKPASTWAELERGTTTWEQAVDIMPADGKLLDEVK